MTAQGEAQRRFKRTKGAAFSSVPVSSCAKYLGVRGSAPEGPGQGQSFATMVSTSYCATTAPS